jgi:hypothetical protein
MKEEKEDGISLHPPITVCRLGIRSPNRELSFFCH